MTITLKVNDEIKKEMQEFFEDSKREKTPAYALFQADDADCVVTVYESGKAVFQGNSADISAQIWIERQRHVDPLNKVQVTNSEDKKKKDKLDKVDKKEYIDPKIYNATTIGSDEVGTGDYFGPVVVTAAYVTKEDIPFLEELGVKDSKKMTDDQIRRVVPQIIKRIKYETFKLTNEKYNEKYASGNNMNKIKAVLHNKALYTLKQKVLSDNLSYDYIVVDQFAKPLVYFSYLTESTEIVKDITFMTKAEDKCLAVACASLISRYIFLKSFEELNDKYEMFFLKGASDKVDDVALSFVKKNGFDELKKIAKMNFKNTDKVKKLLEDLK